MVDCQLQRELSNFCQKRYTPPYVSTCGRDRRCAFRDCNSLYWNQLPLSTRCRDKNYFVRPCYTFPDCCNCQRKRCC